MDRVLLSSEKMDWCTPQNFYDKLNREFHFTLDAAATVGSAKCENFFTPNDDALSQDWSGNVVFLNPPYGRELHKWVKKAYEESLKPDTTVVMLIPSRTDTSYFHDYIIGKSDIRFVKGRLKFTYEDGTELDPAPFPSMLVVYKNGAEAHTICAA